MNRAGSRSRMMHGSAELDTRETRKDFFIVTVAFLLAAEVLEIYVHRPPLPPLHLSFEDK